MGGRQSRPGSSDSDDNDKKPSSDIPSSAAASSSGASAPQSSKQHKNPLSTLPSDVLNREIISRLPFKEKRRARGVDKFFKQQIDEDRLLNVEHACRFICYGQPKELLTLLSHDPERFFHCQSQRKFHSLGQRKFHSYGKNFLSHILFLLNIFGSITWAIDFKDRRMVYYSV